MICIDFRDFLINPLFLDLAIFDRKCFFSILTFQELRDSEKGKVKDHGLEILRQTFWAKVGH
jgi:hypothetical protein